MKKLIKIFQFKFYFKLISILLIIYLLLLNKIGNKTDGLDKFRLIFNSNNEWTAHDYWMKWHQQYWLISLPLSLIYILAVYYGVQFMKNRKPFNLRYTLGIWSALLGIFSIMGSYYFLPEIISKLYNDGFHKAVCDNTYKSDKKYMFWAWLFTWSKVFEFGDTLFIILRKQKLTFLHWFHHAMTVICVFAYFPFNLSINRWTGSMNYAVHSLMYSYYSLKAFRIFIPRFIAFTITISQIAQMFIGFYIACYIFLQKQSNRLCSMSKGQSIFSVTIYTFYFILFLNFFIRTYFMKNKSINNNDFKIDKSQNTLINKLNNLDENLNNNKLKIN